MDSNCDSYYVGRNNDTVYIPIKNDTEIAYPSAPSSTAINCTEYSCPSFTKLVIPSRVNGKPVLEIGCAAFSKIKTLETVEINARITKIHQFAFYGCSNLTNINIPSTVQVLGFCAISAIVVNSGPIATASGVLTIKFEPNSTIQAIERYGIERKQYIIIYYCGYYQPDIVPDSLFYGATTKIVFSPISLNWGGIETEPDPAVCKIIEESIVLRSQQKITFNCDIYQISYLTMGIVFFISEAF